MLCPTPGAPAPAGRRIDVTEAARMAQAWTVAPGVLVQEIDGRAMLLHPAATSALTLNESASAIWAACQDGAQTVDELLTALHEELGVEPEVVRADVESAVSRLLDEGYLLPRS